MFTVHVSLYIIFMRKFIFRFLSLNTVVAYQRAKISSLNIISSDSNGNAHVSTISHTVCVDLAKSETATI